MVNKIDEKVKACGIGRLLSVKDYIVFLLSNIEAEGKEAEWWKQVEKYLNRMNEFGVYFCGYCWQMMLNNRKSMGQKDTGIHKTADPHDNWKFDRKKFASLKRRINNGIIKTDEDLLKSIPNDSIFSRPILSEIKKGRLCDDDWDKRIPALCRVLHVEREELNQHWEGFWTDEEQSVPFWKTAREEIAAAINNCEPRILKHEEPKILSLLTGEQSDRMSHFWYLEAERYSVMKEGEEWLRFQSDWLVLLQRMTKIDCLHSALTVPVLCGLGQRDISNGQFGEVQCIVVLGAWADFFGIPKQLDLGIQPPDGSTKTVDDWWGDVAVDAIEDAVREGVEGELIEFWQSEVIYEWLSQVEFRMVEAVFEEYDINGDSFGRLDPLWKEKVDIGKSYVPERGLVQCGFVDSQQQEEIYYKIGTILRGNNVE